MTFLDFFDLLQPRGGMAKCPAHLDRSASLSIREGRDGRTLLHCHAGCSLDSILAALGLTKRDLFAGSPPTPEAMAEARLIRDALELWRRQQRTAGRAARDRVWKLEAVANALGAKLIHNPKDAELGRLFHLALDRLRKAETALPGIAPELGGLRLEAPADVPAWIAQALTEIGQDIRPESQTARCERAA